MRIRLINREQKTFEEYFSLKEACEAKKTTLHKLKKKYEVERIYDVGYWSDVSVDYLKAICVNRYGYRTYRIQ